MSLELIAEGAAQVIGDVLIHQRPRWSMLRGQGSQREAWWKSEFGLALQSWAWSWDAPHEDLWIFTEHQLSHADLGVGACDLVVGTLNDDGVYDPDGPTVWIELKERHTGWSRKNPNKALLGKNPASPLSDLHKRSDLKWRPNDIALLAVVIVDDRDDERTYLEEAWMKALDEIDEEFPRFRDHVSVGAPVLNDGFLKDPIVRWCTVEFFRIFPNVT